MTDTCPQCGLPTRLRQHILQTSCSECYLAIVEERFHAATAESLASLGLEEKIDHHVTLPDPPF